MCEVITSVFTAYFASRLAPVSGTGVKSRCCAFFFSASKSCPAERNSSTARSRWIQPSSSGWLSAGLSRTTSNMVLVLEPATVAQPYDAGAVSCTISTPSAPWRAPSSYL